ncbi:MAG: VWA domain-containing protein [Dehalococcoidia bacterium]
MSFIWPPMLLSLLLVPILAIAYLRLMGRRAAAGSRLGTTRLTEGASGRRVGAHRHLPPAIFLVATALLLAALARPTVVLALPHMEGTVILAFDVSTSMLADDLKPSRMDAAKRAAGIFVGGQPSTIQIGVVAFSDGALIVQQPTTVQVDVLAAIDRLAPQGGTSLGEGMFASLSAIAGRPIVIDPEASEEDLFALDIGYFGSAVIVLLSDGEHTSRSDPISVAQLAANAGVRVLPIGIGSADGTTLEIEGYRVATALNEPLLSAIATVTDGAYFRAADEAELAAVYEAIDLRLAIDGEEVEVTALVAAAAMLLLVVGAGLTMRWFGRVP